MEQLLLSVIALALAWIALRPHVMAPPAEASRDTLSIDIERVGGRILADGVVPVRCVGRLP